MLEGSQNNTRGVSINKYSKIPTEEHVGNAKRAKTHHAQNNFATTKWRKVE
jgi:hypothetical protein